MVRDALPLPMKTTIHPENYNRLHYKNTTQEISDPHLISNNKFYRNPSTAAIKFQTPVVSCSRGAPPTRGFVRPSCPIEVGES